MSKSENEMEVVSLGFDHFISLKENGQEMLFVFLPCDRNEKCYNFRVCLFYRKMFVNNVELETKVFTQ